MKLPIKAGQERTFLLGLVMFLLGLILFVKNIFVSSSLFSLGLPLGGGFYLPSGILILPLIAGIVWMLLKPQRKAPKVLAASGFLLIVITAIISVHIRVGRIPILLWIIILSLLFGGLAFMLRSFLRAKK